MEIIENDLKSPNHHPWDWRGISDNPNITMEMYKEAYKTFSSDAMIDWIHLLSNENIPFQQLYDFAKEQSEKPSAEISMDETESNPSKVNFWVKVVTKSNTTLDIIEAHIDKWNWEILSQNPNLTIEFIKKHKDNIDFANLSSNTFNYKLIKT
jgi:hypothetical protein